MSQAQQGSIAKVIDRGFCIGCGACAVTDPRFRLGKTETGFVEVVERPRDGPALAVASRVCPFAQAPDETLLAATLFPSAANIDKGVGRFTDVYAGSATEHRSSAGSGGVTRWLMAELLDTRAVDFVITVDRKQHGTDGDLFFAAIHATSAEYLRHCSTSAYYPITFAEVLGAIRTMQGRFAVTALPCFARALRALAIHDPEIGQRLAFVSGVICGGLKGQRYAEYLGSQMGVPSSRLGRIDFRGKSLSRTANEKCVDVWSAGNDGVEPDAVRRVQDLNGTDYGAGYFKPKACDYCDDVFAETADVSFGDAWISPYKDDPSGTNIIVVRNSQIADLLARGVREGSLKLDRLTAEQACLTQASGLRHRREGLSVRLWLARARFAWVPVKRVEPGLGTSGFIVVQGIRIAIRRVTSLRWLDPSSRWFHRISWRLTHLHAKLRRYSVVPQPPGLGRLKRQPNELDL